MCSRILIVHDYIAVASGMAELFQREGYNLAVAQNGSEALYCINSSFNPDMIILDLNMPLMDGYQFRSAQLMEVSLSSIPVVVLSASALSAKQTDQLNCPIVL